MKAAAFRLPASLRKQMQALQGTWRDDERAALLLLNAQCAAASDACDWPLFDALRAARRHLLWALSDDAQRVITESTRMEYVHLPWLPHQHERSAAVSTHQPQAEVTA